MKGFHPFRRLAITLLLTAMGVPFSIRASPWEVRYGTFDTFTQEEIASGYQPSWPVSLPNELDGEITIGPDTDGAAVGRVFLGTELPQEVLAAPGATVELEFMAWSEHAGRSPTLRVMLLPRSVWEALPGRPDEVALDRLPSDSMLVVGSPAPDPTAEDTQEWTSWRSENFIARLRGATEPWMLVLEMVGYHASTTEQVELRNVRIATHEEAASAPLREPLYPLKTERTLLGAEEIERARRNIAQHAGAATIRDTILEKAHPWLERDDEALLRLIPPASVPRAFNVGTAGCPVHGKAIYEHGTYPWKLDVDNPYQVICPIGGETYPSNDFRTFLESGVKDRSLLTGDFPDDGWGWVGPPDDHRYWFVAYAAHWHWRNHILPALDNLQRAYILTGDKRYAHKAAVILTAIALEYPSMDYHNQSRYGQMMAARGAKYPGKILNAIWETWTLQSLAEAYDAIWETIDDDSALQELFGKSGPELRALIEANILEEGIEAVLDGQTIRGNFGMHQSALAAAVAARQHGPTEEWLRPLFDLTGEHPALEGLQYALYNYIYRDGGTLEVGPSYGGLWINSLYEVIEKLRRTGVELPAPERLKMLVQWPLRSIALEMFSPDLGDSGGVYGGLVAPSNETVRLAWELHGEELFLRWLQWRGWTGSDSFTSYRMLFYEPTPDAEQEPAFPGTAGSRLLDGFGLSFLENQNSTIGLSAFHGYRGSHAHRDSLAFDLYAHGQKLMPDPGYPDFMNGYVSGIFSWSQNTAAHNAVMVDRTQQTGRGPAQVTRFHGGSPIQLLEMDGSEDIYPQVDLYRRTLVLVETGTQQAYLVDFFQVRGGSEHHYSLHGPPGASQLIEGQWSEPAPHTLAGPDVEVGELYDAPEMNEPGYQGIFTTYYGSGFSHFENPRHLQSGPAVARYAHLRDPEVGLQLRMLPGAGEEIIAAEAQVSPLKQKERMLYLLGHRRQNEPGLESLFVAVCEPFRGEPEIQAARRTDLPKGVAVEVDRNGATDLLLHRSTPSGELHHDGVRTDASTAVLMKDANGKPVRLFFAGGTFFELDGRTWRHTDITGKVVAVRPRTGELVVAFDQPMDAAALEGTWLSFRQPGGRWQHDQVLAAESTPAGMSMRLKDDLLIARGKIGEIDGDRLQTPTIFGLRQATFANSLLANERLDRFHPVREVESGQVVFAEPLPADFFSPQEQDGGDFHLVAIGPGGEVRLPSATLVELE